MKKLAPTYLNWYFNQRKKISEFVALVPCHQRLEGVNGRNVFDIEGMNLGEGGETKTRHEIFTEDIFAVRRNNV